MYSVVYQLLFQEFKRLSEVETESANFAGLLMNTTSEEEALQVLNEHNHRINLIEARNELSKAEQLESFMRKLKARQKKKRTTHTQQVFGEYKYLLQLTFLL